MTVTVLADAESVARHAADLIAREARAAVNARGRFTVAFSGGRTPGMMLDALILMKVPWEQVHVFQVDERIVRAGHADRNLVRMQARLELVRLDPMRIHPMPVDPADLDFAVERYTRTLEEICGRPPVLDLVHLGMGADGHTASLFRDDPALGVTDADVAVTGPYQGRRRMTLTYPVLNRARRVLWVITGEDKRSALASLERGDPAIPAGRVRQDRAVILVDRAAARRPPAAVDFVTSAVECIVGAHR
jgi:6-phosphogluconolactonase